MEIAASISNQTVQEDHCCMVCLDVFYKPTILAGCGHVFCQSCLNEVAINIDNRKCPLCRASFIQNDFHLQDYLWNMMQKMYPHSLNKKVANLKERVKVSLIIGNTTEVLKDGQINKYKWELYIKSVNTKKNLQKYVDMVEIELHPTFNPSKIQAKIIDNNPITVMKYGWGAFRIGITIYWKDRFNEKFRKVYHDLLFVPLKQATLNLILTVKTLIFFEHIDTLSFSQVQGHMI